MTSLRAVVFLSSVPPNVPGDTAGVPPEVADRYVAVGIARYADADLAPALDFDAMTRAELVAHATGVLGFEGEPPAEITDDEIRTALKAHAAGMTVPGPAEPEAPATLDQLDALDRAHLEAFALTKAGFATIDAALSDDELRAQIRANVETAVSTIEPAARKGGKARA